MDRNNAFSRMVQDSILDQGVEPVAQSSGANNGNWRNSLPREDRHKVVKKIFETLQAIFYPNGAPNGLEELVIRFEDKSYSDATSKIDYMNIIASKLKSVGHKARMIGFNGEPSQVHPKEQVLEALHGSNQALPLNVGGQIISSMHNGLGFAPANSWGPQAGQTYSFGNSQPQSEHQDFQLDPQQNRMKSIVPSTSLQGLQGLHTSTISNQQQALLDELNQLISDSNSQIGGDWQEEIYQKIKCMREKYCTGMILLYQKISSRIHQLETLPSLDQAMNEKLNFCNFHKNVVERFLRFIQRNKNEIEIDDMEKAAMFEQEMADIVNRKKEFFTERS